MRLAGRRPLLTAGLVVLLGVSTLGEGGAEPTALLLWHGAVVALVVIALVAPRPVDRVVARGPLLAWSVFCGLALAGAFAAPYGYAAWLLLLELGAFTAVVVLAARCGPELADDLVGPLLGLAALQAVAAIGRALVLGETGPAGTFLNRNHFGAWLAAVLLLAWGTASRRGGPGPWLRAALSVPVLWALVWTLSRGALLGLGAGAVVLGAARWPTMGVAWRRLVVAAGAVVALGGMGYVWIQRSGERDPFSYHRPQIWRASLEAVIEAPWTGTGPRQFAARAHGLQFPDGDGPLRYDRVFESTHSDVLRVAAEFGLPGALALALALLAGAGRVRRAVRRGEVGSWPGAAAALAALGTQAAVENLSHRPALFLLAACLVGALLSVRARPGAPLASRPRLAAAVLLLLVYVLGDVAPYRAWLATHGLPPGRLDASGAGRLERALALNPLHPDTWSRRAEHRAGDGSDWTVERYAAAREDAERAVRLSPRDPSYRRRLAALEALACRTLFGDVTTRTRADAHYRAAADLAPRNATYPIERAAFLLDTGDVVGARRAAERALALEPEAVQPRLLLAGALASSGVERDAVRARALLAEAEEKARRWADRRGDSPYASRLLTFESRLADKVRAILARGAGPAPGRATQQPGVGVPVAAVPVRASTNSLQPRPPQQVVMRTSSNPRGR